LYAVQVAYSLSWATGYVIPKRVIAAATLAVSWLEGELGRVHADHDEAFRTVLLIPALDVRQRPDAV